MAKTKNHELRYGFLDRCFKYLVQNGLENTSLRDLCKGTGISSGSLYYWFNNKDKLFLEATQYGLATVSDSIFKFIFEHINNLDYFFENFLKEVDKHRMSLRYIYQVATSPIYGEHMRESAIAFNENYIRYADKLCDEFGCSSEAIRPVVFMFASIVLDYAVWGDVSVTKLQLEYVQNILKKELNIKDERMSTQ